MSFPLERSSSEFQNNQWGWCCLQVCTCIKLHNVVDVNISSILHHVLWNLSHNTTQSVKLMILNRLFWFRHSYHLNLPIFFSNILLSLNPFINKGNSTSEVSRWSIKSLSSTREKDFIHFLDLSCSWLRYALLWPPSICPLALGSLLFRCFELLQLSLSPSWLLPFRLSLG